MNEEPSTGVRIAIGSELLRRAGTRRGKELTFLCPSHPDEHPSADWNVEKYTWLCRSCGAGGGWIDLCKRLGIDPFPKAPKAIAPAGEHRYYMIDANDRSIVAIKVRQDDGEGNKKTWWEAPGGIRGLPEGVSPDDLLYGGPWGETDCPVFLVEGERAARALYDTGKVAAGTTSGAGGIPTESALERLRGHRIDIWPDNDEPGIKHAEAIAQRLWGMGIQELYIVEWPAAPEKGDAADFVAAGALWSDLFYRRWEPPQDAWAPVLYAGQRIRVLGLGSKPAPPKPPDLVEGLIARGDVTAFIADGGVGKSTLLQAVAACLATGERLAGLEVTPARCLYLDWEDNAAVFTDRLRRLYRGLGVAEPYPEVPWASMSDLFKNGAKDIVEAANELDAQLIAIDTMGPAQGSAEGSAEKATLELFQALRPLHGRTVVMLDHLAKSTEGTKKKAYGSVYKGNLARSVWSVVGRRDERIYRQLDGTLAHSSSSHLVLTHEKSNHGPLHEPIGLLFTWLDGEIRIQQEIPLVVDGGFPRVA